MLIVYNLIIELNHMILILDYL